MPLSHMLVIMAMIASTAALSHRNLHRRLLGARSVAKRAVKGYWQRGTESLGRGAQPMRSRRRCKSIASNQILPAPLSYGEGEESVYARLVTQAVTTKDASNKRAVEALVGGKVDWMDGNETAKLQNRLQDVRLNLEHPFWKFCLSSPEPATIELISNENLKVQALVVPIAATVIRHYPPGSFLMQKMVSGAGTRARVRSLIYSRMAGGITTEVSRRSLEANPVPWVFYGGPMREISTESDSTGPIVLLEVLITPPGRPVTLSPNHTKSLTLDMERMMTMMTMVDLPADSKRSERAPADFLDLGKKNPKWRGEGLAFGGAELAQPLILKDEETNEKHRNASWSNRSPQSPQIDIDKISLRVGGHSSTLQNITRRILMSRVLLPDLARELGIGHVRGLLLHGPPGCGKTLLAREIARSLNSKSVSIVSGPEILSKYVGDAEKTVRGLFYPAEVDQQNHGNNVQGTGLHVIIMDEFDSVFKRRGVVEDGGVRDSVCNQLLAKMDGVQQLDNIVVIGLTNRPELIDPALLRPGRFEVQIKVERPDYEARQEILNIHLRPILDNGEYEEVSMLRARLDSGWLARRTEGYSGADIAGLVRSMVSFAFQRALDATESKYPDGDEVMITVGDLEAALLEIDAHTTA